MQRILQAAAVAVLSLVAGPLSAQEQPKEEELQFVRQLRAKGYPDLALEYLEKRLGKDPMFAGDLPLEIAQIRMEVGKLEPDPAKRVALYTQVRNDLRAFLDKNPAHARAGQAKLQIATLGVDIGKTQLARAESLPENDETRVGEFAKARAMFVDAADQLKKTAAGLTDDEEKSKAEFENALMLLSQARTYVTEKDERERGNVIAAACSALEKLGEKLPNKYPIRWIALAWAGRARSMNGQPKEAETAFKEALGGNEPTATQLVHYFRILGDQEKQEENAGGLKDVPPQSLVDRSTKWLLDFRQFQTSPEGFGHRYILAKQLFKVGTTQAWLESRKHIRFLEQTDNEFTAKASQIKIDIFFQEKKFTQDVKTLLSFEDCYMRSLYEHQRLSGKEADKLFDTDEKKLAQQKLVIEALKKAIEKNNSSLNVKASEVELGNTVYLLAGYKLSMYQQAKAIYKEAEAKVKELEANDKKEEAKAAKVKEVAARAVLAEAEKTIIDAVASGEDFIKKHPKVKQASTIAMFLVRGLSLILEDAGDDVEVRPTEREKLYQISRMLVDNFPGDRAGDLGRHYVVMHLLGLAKKPTATPAERSEREKEAIQVGGDLARFHVGIDLARDKKFVECMQVLKAIKPDFANYTISQYQIGLAALEIDKDNAQRASTMQPLTTLPDDKRPLKDIAIEAFEKIPDPQPEADRKVKLFYLQAKMRLSQLLYSVNKYEQMEQLSAKLKPMLDRYVPAPGGEEEKKNLEVQLRSIDLYRNYGRADTLYKASKYKETADLLKPVVDALDRGEYPELKDNAPLRSGILGLALRGNLQAEQHAGALAVLNTWKKIDPDKDTVTKVLQQTVISLKTQIDDLKKKNDKVLLQKTADSFDAFLGQLIAGSKEQLTVEMKRLYAQCYMSIGKYAKAAGMLKDIPAPKPDADAREKALYNVIQVMLVRALRLEGKETGNKKLLQDAEVEINKLLGTKEAPGPGQKDINALKEQIWVFIDLEYYGAATNRARELRDVLRKLLEKGTAYQEHFFDVCYMYLIAHTRYAQSLMNATQKAEHFRQAAQFLSQLKSTYPTLGGEDSLQRFSEFLYSDEGKPLRDIYDGVAKPK